MKTCSRCKKEPKLDNHPAYCGKCRREYAKEWRKKNPNYRKSYKKPTREEANRSKESLRRRNWNYVMDIKKDTPCADCDGTFFPSAMHFDHIRGKKLMNIGTAAHQSWSIKKLQQEIDKCELVCANCHAVRTWGQKPYKYSNLD